MQSLGKEFSRWLESTEDAQITVYHDGIGVDWLAPLDPCPNKVLYLHNWFPRWEKNFQWTLRFTGRVLISSQVIADELTRRFPWIPSKFIIPASQPMVRDSLSKASTSSGKLRTGIWLQGKSWKRHANRLRGIVDNWSENTGQLEIIATGSRCPGWANKDYVRWSMNLPLEFALLRLFTWDSTLLLNDFALSSPWLLRALELGVFPLVPGGEGIARTGAWVEDNAPRPYEWGDVAGAINILGKWRNSSGEFNNDFRKWTRGYTIELGGYTFEDLWSVAKDSILQQKAPVLRRSRPKFGWMPLTWYEHIQRLRAGL
jgi:hypothetical protein